MQPSHCSRIRGWMGLGLLAVVAWSLNTACRDTSPPLDPVDPEAHLDSEAHRCLTETLYWEARAEGEAGMTAVGWVVLNRLTDDRFPASVCDVVRQGGERRGCQFSYWCDGKGDEPASEPALLLAEDVATELLSSPPLDPTEGALFYHATSLSSVPWSVERTRTVQIGRHIYYR